ncbi:MAG: PhoH family protein [Gammaproteobacteria bacterium]|nr:PhoH family protein [Gammaproteobacteria bacterium]
MPEQVSVDFVLEPNDTRRLASLCGHLDDHIRQIETRLGIEINNRGNQFRVIGDEGIIHEAVSLLKSLYNETASHELNAEKIHLSLQQSSFEALTDEDDDKDAAQWTVTTRRGKVQGRGPNQKAYVRKILTHDINFGVGPAGTGKTYLAVACAVQALEREEVGRIMLVRPAVEAGERLGFLPGDLSQKVDPYLRPLYDALYEMMGFERVERLLEKQVIEIAPLAFMRGRTLNDSFIILDEAQNTTHEQMKMFLTRIGFGSTAVITGDITQIDLPRASDSGLEQATHILSGVEGISFTFFNSRDVVRHPLVQRIVRAYASYDLPAK